MHGVAPCHSLCRWWDPDRQAACSMKGCGQDWRARNLVDRGCLGGCSAIALCFGTGPAAATRPLQAMNPRTTPAPTLPCPAARRQVRRRPGRGRRRRPRADLRRREALRARRQRAYGGRRARCAAPKWRRRGHQSMLLIEDRLGRVPLGTVGLLSMGACKLRPATVPHPRPTLPASPRRVPHPRQGPRQAGQRCWPRHLGLLQR